MTPAEAAGGTGWLEWLAATPAAQAMRAGAWLYPAVEIVHIAAFAVLVGAVAMFDLRVLGLGRTLPLRPLACHLLPWSVAGMVFAAASGLLLFCAQAPQLAASRVFFLKLALVGAAALNAWGFHAGPWRNVDRWQDGAPVRARLHAALSLLLWLAVIACGRLVAYA
jgi:hypothetical protein